MSEWLASLWDVLTLRAGHNTLTVMAGATSFGAAAGLVGAHALLRRRSLVADAVGHATLPGVAIAFLLTVGLGADRSLAALLLGAAASATLGVATIQALVRWTRLKEDAAIGIVLGVFFGAGVTLLSVVQKLPTGGQGGIDGLIYGQTAAMITADAWLIASLALVALVATVALHKELAAVGFNEGFARASGLRTLLVDGALLALIVVVSVAGLRSVGLLLVVAMLVIPAAAARFWTERMTTLLALSTVIGALSAYLGAAVSATRTEAPAGAVIVLTATALFVVSMLLAPERGVIAAVWRRALLHLRLSADHLVEWLYEHEQHGAEAGGARAMGRSRGLGPVRTAALVGLARLRGHVRLDRGEPRLTDAGRRAGARIYRNHRLWEQYLVAFAEVAPSHVDWSVDQVEHVLSDALVHELEAALREQGVRLPSAAGAGA